LRDAKVQETRHQAVSTSANVTYGGLDAAAQPHAHRDTLWFRPPQTSEKPKMPKDRDVISPAGAQRARLRESYHLERPTKSEAS